MVDHTPACAGDRRVLVVGGGGRAHALGQALARSPSVGEVVFAPGTTGLEHLGYATAPVASQDFAGLVEHAALEEYDLTVIGPNTPLVDGVVDRFEAAGIPVFGPTRAAARLEGSKVFARLMMQHLGIPTPRFAICDTPARARYLGHTQRWARVFKADGIAYGKGVRVTYKASEVDRAIEDVMVDNVYGLESERVVVEERIDGLELTVFSLTDGEHVEVLGDVLNHPRLGDGDTGPPTRGMGQVSPTPASAFASRAGAIERITREVLEPTVREMADRGAPIRGALFVDFMLVRGEPFAIDYNVRFGDPATQTLLSAYRGDLFGALDACRRGSGLREAVQALERDPRPRVSVVLACDGYPERRVRGAAITLPAERFEADPDLALFYDGVRAHAGGLETTGGRTFTVVAAADTVPEARARAYEAVGWIRFEGMRCRRDIGALQP